MVRKLALATLLLTGFGVHAASASTITLDLTTAGAGCRWHGSHWRHLRRQAGLDQSTGTGVIDSFLGFRTGGTEDGYNTSLSQPPSTTNGGVFTRALLLTEVPIITIAGVDYRQFLLDINQIDQDKPAVLHPDPEYSSRRATATMACWFWRRGTDMPMPSFAGAGWIEAFRLDTLSHPAPRSSSTTAPIRQAVVATCSGILRTRCSPPGIRMSFSTLSSASCLASTRRTTASKSGPS